MGIIKIQFVIRETTYQIHPLLKLEGKYPRKHLNHIKKWLN
jgi:hypothetical protein